MAPIYNRPLRWDEVMTLFPGCETAWDELVIARGIDVIDPRLMVVHYFDHIPCSDSQSIWCPERICSFEDLRVLNVKVLTAALGEGSRYTYDVVTQRWDFTGGMSW